MKNSFAPTLPIRLSEKLCPRHEGAGQELELPGEWSEPLGPPEIMMGIIAKVMESFKKSKKGIIRMIGRKGIIKGKIGMIKNE